MTTENRILAQRQQLKSSNDTLSNSNTPVISRKSFSTRASLDQSVVFEEYFSSFFTNFSSSNSINSTDSRVIPYKDGSIGPEDSETNASSTAPTESSSDQGASLETESEHGYDSDEEKDSKGLSPAPLIRHNDPTRVIKRVNMVLYIQMQYYSNSTLSDFLQAENREIDITQVRKIFHQIVEGVREIHSKGFIHRDLKPKNIFLSEDKTVKV